MNTLWESIINYIYEQFITEAISTFCYIEFDKIST